MELDNSNQYNNFFSSFSNKRKRTNNLFSNNSDLFKTDINSDGLSNFDKLTEENKKMLDTYINWPNYRNNWISLGFNEDDLSGQGSNRFLDSMVAWGSKNQVCDRIKEHFSAGADHVCIQPMNPDGTYSVDWNALETISEL